MKDLELRKVRILHEFSYYAAGIGSNNLHDYVNRKIAGDQHHSGAIAKEQSPERLYARFKKRTVHQYWLS